MLRVGDIACGRAGDKGATLDLTIVAVDRLAYELLARELTSSVVAGKLQVPGVSRYELPVLGALKFVVPGVLGGGTYASLRAGMHWQKAAVNALLDMELMARPGGLPRFCVRPPGWTHASASDAFARMRDWAARAEELGFDALFVGDRLLAQAPGPRGPIYGATMLECTTVLAAFAGVTERIELGPLVMVLPYRHPVQLAKTLATLDVIAGGRLILGAGLGWNEAEFHALGIARSERAARYEQALSLVRRLWTGESVTASGFWELSSVRVDPLPVRPGGPPVWMAAFSPGSPLDWVDQVPARLHRSLDRAGRLADGWVPLIYSASAKRRISSRVLARAWEHVLASAAAAGRARSEIDFVYSDWCYVLDGSASEERCRKALAEFFPGSWEEAKRTYTIGKPEQIAEQIVEHTGGIDCVDAYVLTPLTAEIAQLEGLQQVVAEIQRRR